MEEGAMGNGSMGNGMTHPTELFADYLLGDLGSLETTQLETHLATCESCNQDLARLAAPLVTLTEALPQTAPPGRTWESLQVRFREAVADKAALESLSPEASERSRPVAKRPPPTAAPYRWLLAACFMVAALGGSLFWGWQNYTAYRQVQAEVTQLSDFLARPQVQKVVLENVIGSERTESPGSALLTPDGAALFVLNDAAPPGSAYQAWGHTSGDWDPEGGESLSSLLVSQSKVFEVEGGSFASLYLSIEPEGGSPQPTQPLSKVSLFNARPTGVLELNRPEAGAVLSNDSVIVSGEVGESVTSLRYSLNGGAATEVNVSGNRFTFTVNGLEPGQNTIEVTAETAVEPVRQSVNISYQPDDSR